MVDAFFLPLSSGRRFCLHHRSHIAPDRGGIIYLHPFAEEMNKSRRMAGLQARALAAAGYDVLQIDLHGCGDSDGDFGDATWASWIDDALAAHAWLSQRVAAPIWFWGLRTGCLLAAAAARSIGAPTRLLFWQPVVSGKQYLQQFLRLKVAGEMLSGDAKGVMEALRQELAAGCPVEVAGYTLSPGLANGLEQAELQAPPAAQAVWLELSNRPDAQPTPATRTRAEQWRKAGWEIEHTLAAGPAFWQTVEIEDAPDLIEASLRAFGKDTVAAVAPT